MSFSRATWILAAASVIWAFVLAIDLVPQLRGDYGWRWPYAEPENYAHLLPLIISLTIYIGLGWKFQQFSPPHLLLLWSIFGGMTLTIAALYVTTDRPRYELYTRTISGLTGGWHYAAADIDDQGGAHAVLQDWPNFMANYQYFSSHMTTSPPGMPLTYYGANQLLTELPAITDKVGPPLRTEQCHNYRFISYTDAELSSAWLGILTPLWSSLIALPLYWLGRRFFFEGAARWSVLWWPLVPAFLMFTPTPNTLYPCLTLIVIAFLAKGVLDKGLGWILASGFGVGVLTFLHFTLLPILFFAGLFTLGMFFSRRKSENLRWHWPFIIGGVFGIGLITIWGGFYLLSGVTILDIIDQALTEHLILERPYFPWLFLHLNDFFMFTGWPLTLLAGMGLWKIIFQVQRREINAGGILGISAFITLVVLDLSGTQRGESGRIWLFLSPFAVLLASSLFTEGHEFSGKLMTIVQATMVVVMVGFLRVIGSGLTNAPITPPALTEMPTTPVIPNGARLNDTIDLTSFAGHIEMLPDVDGNLQSTLILWLNWRSHGLLEKPYYLSFIPVSPQGQAKPASVLQPFDEQFPTTCWRPESGEIHERLEIPLYSENLGGDWWVSLSLMDRAGTPLPVVTSDGARDQQVGLGPFRALE